jgi:hypothetical protein
MKEISLTTLALSALFLTTCQDKLTQSDLKDINGNDNGILLNLQPHDHRRPILTPGGSHDLPHPRRRASLGELLAKLDHLRHRHTQHDRLRHHQRRRHRRHFSPDGTQKHRTLHRRVDRSLCPHFSPFELPQT